MKRRLFGSVGLFVSLAAISVACSSSSDDTSGQPETDSGTGGDSGSTTDGSVKSDGGISVVDASVSDSGTNDSGSSTDSGAATITVAGQALGPTGAPFAFTTVVVGNTPALTDATGHFTVSGVVTPYTANVILPGTHITVLSYQGLTRTDPTLVAAGFNDNQITGQDITGTLSGATFPEPANTVTLLTFGSTQEEGTGSGFTSGTDNTFSIAGSIDWFGYAKISGSVYALQYVHAPAGTEPTSYNGYGKLAVADLLDNGNPPRAIGNIALTGGITTSTLTATITAPAGATISGRNLSLRIDGTTAIQLPDEDSPAAGSITYTTPNITGATVQVNVSADLASGGTSTIIKGGLASSATAVPIVLADAPIGFVPVNGATGINDDSNFTWTKYNGGSAIYLMLAAGSGPTHPEYIIYTASTSTKLPDVSSVGVELPKNEAYVWLVEGVGPTNTLDAFESATSFPPPNFTEISAATTNVQFSFTTAP